MPLELVILPPVPGLLPPSVSKAKICWLEPARSSVEDGPPITRY